MTQVKTEHGLIEGAVVDGLHVFRNVPFAAPPFGALRFEPPAPPESWDGIRDATRAGVAAPQPIPSAKRDAWGPLFTPKAIGEDCLTLEVWTPDPGSAGLPVLVHIHGGGYVFGAGSAGGHSGRSFARDGVVHVSINYRLGVDGFVFLGEGHDNLGLRDQAFALEWVQRNIAEFGGDPARVTIMGQSGGAVSVLNQTVMPGSQGLFARAIAQSGSTIVSTDPDTAAIFTRRVAKRLKVAPTVEGLRDVPIERTVKTAYRLAIQYALRALKGDESVLLISPFQAVHGTEVLPQGALAAAGSSAVPLLTGTCRHEAAGFVEILTGAPGLGRVFRRGLSKALPLDDHLRAAYQQGPRGLRTEADLIEAAWTDWAFRIPTIRQLERRPDPSWLYEFRWAPLGLSAVHAMEIPFMRDDLALARTMVPEASKYYAGAPQDLADDVHGAFLRFVTDGDPGWDPYAPERRATMVFDTTSGVQDDPAGAEREAWRGTW